MALELYDCCGSENEVNLNPDNFVFSPKFISLLNSRGCMHFIGLQHKYWVTDVTSGASFDCNTD